MENSARPLWPVSILVLLCGALLCGCGGGEGTSTSVKVAGNWHFDSTSTASGVSPVAIDGIINQSGTSLSGIVHVDGSNCLDWVTDVGLTGTVSGNHVSLTSTSVAGQSTTFSGSISGDTFAGTYKVKGGCADGDQGNVIGIRLFPITNSFAGTFTPSEGEIFDGASYVAQDKGAGSDGNLGLTGTVSFHSSCFTLGTLKSGKFPSGSFIVGTSTALEVETSNGTVTFRGRLDPASGKIAGDYTVSGGTCDQTGTALLIAANPWDY
jgi:hypothetical protein